MGDPLSVAGSAVGIISLGIQVCQGLVQYADAVRGQQRDVDGGMDEVRSLLAVFKSLEQTITRIEIDNSENAKSLLEHLRQAEAKLQSLQEVLTEVGIPVNASSNIKGKMKETYRAAIYPMKKSKLEGARQSVQSILSILTTALQTVDLDLGASHSGTLKALQSSTTSNASELKVAIEANSGQLRGLQATCQRGFSDLNGSLVLARAEVQDFSSRSTSQLDSVSVDVKENLESTRLLVRMIGDLSLQINASAGSHNQWLIALIPKLYESDRYEEEALGCLLDIIEPDEEYLIKAILDLYPALDCIFPLLQSRIASLDVSPMAWAILSRSMSDLEYQLKLAPTSVLEKTYGYTTLQLASDWPQGFMRLTQTDARALLHEPMPRGNLLAPRPISGFNPCWNPSTLETLLDAGYTLFPDNKYFTLRSILEGCTDTTVRVIARHLSQRLRQLSELAAQLGITSNDDPSIPDFVTAARWCLSLEEFGESVDPSIRVPMSDDMVTTIYHFGEMPFCFFPIFYAHGFIHVNACDQWGLPPLFVRHQLFWYKEEYFLSQRVPNDYLEIFRNLPWLRKHGFLSQKPHDPLGLGLNIDATGAHRVAAEMGSDFYVNLGDQQDVDHYLSLATDLLWQLARDSYGDLDKCVCWCNSDGDGCSPIKLLYKSLAHPIRNFNGISVLTRDKLQAASITRLLFDFGIFEIPTATPTPSVKQQRERDETTNAHPSIRALGLVRLLTFEALEMTHTCCMLGNLDTGNWRPTKVILNCNPNTVRDIRQSEIEQRNAVQLDTLMGDFTNVMQQDYQAKSVLDFIFGYWKTRIEDLYAVQEDEVQMMQQHVHNVRTGIWPIPLHRLLWFRYCENESEDSESLHEKPDPDDDENDN
ncbi:hypothetical protein BHE90_000586 [Fusarium euwallaceae]|uniref:Fungal N-terminal domain-containing protein n=1 Tax=Fusarium euwallaceae TaxID=1147111 RepID=A0A430MA32_9HYPO|nr:hypothetical protein BHE90_000586 [Fusarium euwallaceae]